MRKSGWFAVGGASVLWLGVVCVADAQPAAQQSSVLYCRGPLNTFRTDGGKTIRTTFKWAKDAAGKENPGPGECAWFDRAPQGTEKPGGDSVMVGNLGPFDSLPVQTFGKVCVTKVATPGPGQENDFTVKQIVRQLGHQTAPFHVPPFTADGC